MVCDRVASRASLIEPRTFESADVTDEDFLETIAEASAAPSPDRNSFAFASSDWDIANEPFARPDEQSCSDASDGGCRASARGSDACCEDLAPQNRARLIAD